MFGSLVSFVITLPIVSICVANVYCIGQLIMVHQETYKLSRETDLSRHIQLRENWSRWPTYREFLNSEKKIWPKTDLSIICLLIKIDFTQSDRKQVHS